MKGKIASIDWDEPGHNLVQVVWECGCAWDKTVGQVICPKHRVSG